MKKLISIFAILTLLMVTSVSADTYTCNMNCNNGVVVEELYSNCAETCSVCSSLCEDFIGNEEGYQLCIDAACPSTCDEFASCVCDDCCGGCDKIPEFGAIGAGIALLGVGAYMLKKRK